MKKLVGILLTLAMVVAMSITTFAEENGTTQNSTQYTITADNLKSKGHEYEIYQIFTGDLDDKGVLSNIKWGKNGKERQGNAVSEVDLEKLTKLNGVNEKTGKSYSNKEKLEVISSYANFENTAYATVRYNESVEVDPGYYLIKDKDKDPKDTTIPENKSYTLYLVKVSKNMHIEPKAEVPSSQKKVMDRNDTTDTINTKNDWIDSADYDIGDNVPFQLTGTVASDYDNYTVYKFIFHDTQSKGLTFLDTTVKVKVDGNSIENTSKQTYYSVNKTINQDGTTDFTVEFSNLKLIDSVKAGSTITVEYESTLNKDAVLGSTGNPNTMHLEYSNNPNDEQGGETGKTPDDKVIVFTYKLVINKKDGEGNILAGADFKLEKKNPDGVTWSEVEAKRKITELVTELEGVETVTLVKDNTKYTATRFTFTGLDDGEYKLTETQTPAGYNTIAPITFTVTAEHDILSDNPSLTKLEGGVGGSGEITLTPMQEDGSLTTNIVNKAGSTLPETGGMGTTILYVVGAILVIGAGILLVTKKRMNANK